METDSYICDIWSWVRNDQQLGVCCFPIPSIKSY